MSEYKTIARLATTFTTFIGEVVGFEDGRVMVHWNKEIAHFPQPDRVLWERPEVDLKFACYATPNTTFQTVRNNSITQFTYPGYMSQEAQEFFEDHIIREERDGCAVVGSFIKLADGTITLPSKGDVFVKDSNNIYKK